MEKNWKIGVVGQNAKIAAGLFWADYGNLEATVKELEAGGADRLYFFDAERKGNPGWIRLETIQSYPGAAVPPARSIVGWDRTHAENAYRFLKSVFEGTEPDPGINDGVWVHLITDAAYASAAHGGWVKVGTP